MKFVANGQLYRGSKPVMWSVVEKTALAEAEIEYHDYTSDTVWVKFPVASPAEAGLPEGAAVVIWTTTPWTLPGNRAISFSSRIDYGLYEVTKAPEGNWAKPGDTLILAEKLAEPVMKAAKVEAFELRAAIGADVLAQLVCQHPLKGLGGGYDFAVPLLDGDHVTDEDGTGFVHTAPGHGRDDFEIWMASTAALIARGIDTAIPFTVDADGRFTNDAPGFEGKRVLKENGDKGDANDAVIKALVGGQRADRARPPEAPVPALLALQEARHLPQHAAVVHRHGPADRGRAPSPRFSGERAGVRGSKAMPLQDRRWRARSERRACGCPSPYPLPASGERGSERLDRRLHPAPAGAARHRRDAVGAADRGRTASPA